MLCENVTYRLCHFFGVEQVAILSARQGPFNAAGASPNSAVTAMSDPAKSIVLVGLMGAGKTSVGRKLADRLGLPFIDADEEIVRAAGCSIEDIFNIYGEPAFRDVEERVVARILDEGPSVLATGGGAFMNPNIRAMVTETATSLWLRADLDALVERTSRRNDRPLLKNGDPKEILKNLMEQRYPVYAEADLTVDTGGESLEETLSAILEALDGTAPEANGAPKNEQ